MRVSQVVGGRGQRAARGPATGSNKERLKFCSHITHDGGGLFPRHVAPGRVVQPSTLMPMERAVPAMIFSAASIVVAFRSGILVCAMSRTWALVMLPTLVLCGSALPLSTPAAFLISSAAGGVLVMKVKVRSS